MPLAMMARGETVALLAVRASGKCCLHAPRPAPSFPPPAASVLVSERSAHSLNNSLLHQPYCRAFSCEGEP